MRLISMVEFVLQQDKINGGFGQEEIDKVWEYANFLNQSLTLGMFVPCDEDGNVLEEPNGFDLWISGIVSDSNEYNKYQQAKDKVLFENRDEFRDWDFTDIENSKIEDLITDGFEYVLNDNAIKQLKL